MPWHMHRLTVGDWLKIVEDAEQRKGGGAAGELPEGWENLPMEG